MDPDVFSFAFVAVTIVLCVGALAAITITSLRFLRRPQAQAFPLADDDRLERLQQSVDAIAIEVERIAEAQRFSAKLLVERGESESLRR